MIKLILMFLLFTSFLLAKSSENIFIIFNTSGTSLELKKLSGIPNSQWSQYGLDEMNQMLAFRMDLSILMKEIFEQNFFIRTSDMGIVRISTNQKPAPIDYYFNQSTIQDKESFRLHILQVSIFKHSDIILPEKYSSGEWKHFSTNLSFNILVEKNLSAASLMSSCIDELLRIQARKQISFVQKTVKFQTGSFVLKDIPKFSIEGEAINLQFDYQIHFYPIEKQFFIDYLEGQLNKSHMKSNFFIKESLNILR